MKLGIIGLSQAGKSTLFEALTGARGEQRDAGHQRGARIATITVMDPRVDLLSELFKPKKTTYARIEYLLPSLPQGDVPSRSEAERWNQVRTCDALVHVVRNFERPDGMPPLPEKDFHALEDDMVLADLGVVEKRLERLELDAKRGKKPDPQEAALLVSCRAKLEAGEALRGHPELATDPLLRGFTLLAAKPLILVLNNGDEDENLPNWARECPAVEAIAVRARLERDIAPMTPEEAEEFRVAYHIQESVLDRLIRSSYSILERISFFTVGEDEVRAWPIHAHTPAIHAAGSVHSDMEKGFIRAEVVSFEDFKAKGGYAEARKAGLVRLEGKDYPVKDGDIINFRFNV